MEDTRASPTCVFMTGVTSGQSYFHGIRCVIRRLRLLHSRIPLVVAVPPTEVEHTERELKGYLGANVSLLRWKRIEHDVTHLNMFHAKRWSGTRVLDKLNVLNAPFRRVVWLDADVLLKRNVDHLCALPPNVSFYAVLNHGFEPRTCWTRNGRFADQCRECRHHGLHRDELAASYWVREGVRQQAAGNRSGMAPCTYEYNSGVMVLEPLNRSAFHEQVVNPIRRGKVPSSDGSDQGFLNSLIHGHHLFGQRHEALSSTYNVVHRVQMLRGATWKRLDPAIVHLVGARKPWGDDARRDSISRPSPYFEQEREWLRWCG
ncbi:hypothetical protein AB1Y20_021358 [Prymnesium parvum]|uniref:Hexosyltransferase n=1 Tax=Prymnesium parvum TaxID=97485 RepID=A0AB34JJD2_PRYPA